MLKKSSWYLVYFSRKTSSTDLRFLKINIWRKQALKSNKINLSLHFLQNEYYLSYECILLELHTWYCYLGLLKKKRVYYKNLSTSGLRYNLRSPGKIIPKIDAKIVLRSNMSSEKMPLHEDFLRNRPNFFSIVIQQYSTGNARKIWD